MTSIPFDFEKAKLMRQEFENCLEMLRTADKNIYVFGAGVYAKSLTDYLNGKGITIKGYVVDDEYALKNPDKGFLALNEVLSTGNMVLLYGIGGGFSDFYTNKVEALKEAVSKNSDSSFIVLNDYWFVDTGLINHEIIDEAFLKDNLEAFSETYGMLEDEFSRKTMLAYLYASVGHDATELSQTWNDTEHDYNLDLLFDKCGDGLVVECGAFNGMSIAQMSDYTGNKYKMLALECDDINYEKCCETVSGYDNIQVIKKGVLDKQAWLKVVHSKDASYLVELKEGEDIEGSVEVIDIDTLVGAEKVAVLTMDIEGSEMKALTGAKNVIASGANIAVRIYHKNSDLITIPQYIKSLNPNYKFYLRYNRGASQCRTGDETTLYAII